MFKKLIYSLVFLFSTTAFSEQYSCPNSFFNGAVPLVKYDQQLCFKGYSVLYSYKYKIPVVSAEHLSADDVKGAEEINRKTAFHREQQLPVKYASTPKDYSHSGYDMGHMTPAGDMANESEQYESFSLSNMTPQTPALNRVTWRRIENTTRAMAKQYGSIYVVTGSIVNENSMMLDYSVRIPDVIYKAIYVPSTGKVQIFVAPNDKSKSFTIMIRETFKATYGIDPFPGI